MRHPPPLRREVRVPTRPVPPFGALIALASIAMLVAWAWFGAAVSSQSSGGCPYQPHRSTSAPATDAPPPSRIAPAPAPDAREAVPDCAFAELLDCSYGGIAR